MRTTDPGTRLRRQQEALLSLARSWPRHEADVDAAIKAITETAVNALQVERASVWVLDRDPVQLTLRDLFETTPRAHSNGVVLLAAEYPAYFDALQTEEAIVADDAHTDPRTSEFSASYLTPLGIGAMLDAPIRLGGRAVGVLCNEHMSGSRAWTVDEQNVATYLAALVSLALEFDRRSETERRLAKSVAILQATLEATAEAILAVDDRGTILTWNETFARTWSLPGSLLARPEDTRAWLRHVLRQIEEPEAHLADIRSALARPLDELSGVVSLVDGRVIEWTTRPQLADGQVVGRVWSYRDVTVQTRTQEALRESEQRLRELATRDALTGLVNRRSAMESLEREVSRASRTGATLSIAMLDLDYFKAINDTHGHMVGDDVLRAFADDLRDRLRASDTIARIGGEEFLVILPDTTAVASRQLIDRLREHVGRTREGLPQFHVSAGVAAYPVDAESSRELLSAADARLYEAKRTGRNRVC